MKNIMKALCIILALMLIFCSTAVASDNMQLCINGKYIILKDSDSMIVKENRSFIPVRAVAELLGYSVEWNSARKEVSITNDIEYLKLQIENKSYSVNSQEFDFDVAPFIKDSLTYVPIRLLESLNTSIEYNKNYNTVIIAQKDTKSLFNDNGIRVVSSTLNASDDRVTLEIEIKNNSIWDIEKGEIVLGIFGDSSTCMSRINETDVPRGSSVLLKEEFSVDDFDFTQASHIKVLVAYIDQENFTEVMGWPPTIVTDLP